MSDGIYNVVIKASDDAPGAESADDDPIMHAFKKVSIEVTNVSESKLITFDRRFPQVNVLGDRLVDRWRRNQRGNHRCNLAMVQVAAMRSVVGRRRLHTGAGEGSDKGKGYL